MGHTIYQDLIFLLICQKIYITSNIILVISDTKLDENFPVGQFFIDGYNVLFRFDKNGNGGGILLYIREDIPLKLLSIYQDIEGFFRGNKFAL